MRALFPFMLVGTLLGAILGLAHASLDEPSRLPQRVAKFDMLFDAADRDGDGAWNKDEAYSARLHRIVERFDWLDADGNGKLTREETRALLKRPLI